MAFYKEGLEEEIIRAFYELYNLMEVILKYKTSESLTLKESFIIEIIKRLTESNDHIVSNVADILNITNASASIAISTLEKKGYVSRVRSKTDRRVYYIELTAKGKLINKKQQEFRERALNDIFGQLNMVEKASIASSLKKMRQFVKKDTERIRKDKSSIVNKD
jgi:DNA-binding MarR family transcriptional regulator